MRMSRWLILGCGMLIVAACVASPPLPLPIASSPVPLPTPDPFAACLHDPANVPPPAKGTTFHTCGGRILAADGKPAQITGASWFGMETGAYAPHGLWTRNWHAMLDQIAGLGFNTVRLPFSNEALVAGRSP